MADFSAKMDEWTRKAKANIDQVVKGACEDVFELMTRRQASITETGTYREGFVPVDTGFLIASARLSINGQVVGAGIKGATGEMSFPPDYAVAIEGMEMGDTVTGYFTANYARHVEYGHGNVPGRYFVRNAIMQWPVIVEANARYIGED